MSRKKPNAHMDQINDRGFTLLEILIAIVILSIGLLGMASLTVGIINANKFSKELTTATTLAHEKMEDIRRIGYTNANSAIETKTVLPSPNDEYKREVTVTIDTPATDMKTVIVKVYWGGASKEDHNVELKTILAQ